VYTGRVCVCVCVCRRVLTDAGYQLSDDRQFVIYVSDDDVDDDVSDAADSDVTASWVACSCDAVVEDDWH